MRSRACEWVRDCERVCVIERDRVREMEGRERDVLDEERL